MMNFKSSITALVLMLIIPVIGYLISNAILNDLNSDVDYDSFVNGSEEKQIGIM